MSEMILKHWRGEYSLGRAFWGNFLGLLILALFVGAIALISISMAFPHARETLKIVLPLLIWGIIFPWQSVGVWRSAEKAKSATGSNLIPILAQIFIVLYAFGLVMRVLKLAGII